MSPRSRPGRSCGVGSQGLRLYANGIVDEMLLDYGDFVLRAELDVLEALPEIECKAE